jgi:hypothetical protein
VRRRFVWEPGDLIFAQCNNCKHFHRRIEGRSTCDAYPDPATEIPDEILSNYLDHREPQPGDRGIRWEPEEPDDKHPGVQEAPADLNRRWQQSAPCAARFSSERGECGDLKASAARRLREIDRSPAQPAHTQ